MKKKEPMYVQCALLKNGQHHMAYIPEKFAVIGKIIKINDDDGWEVIGDGGGIKVSASDANFQSQLYKKTRKASDI